MQRVQRILFLQLLALSFMTRLAPARPVPPEDMRACSAYFPLVGVILSTVLLLPFIFIIPKGFDQFFLLKAFAYVTTYTYLTRALHHDGVADICDALGSSKQGEAFQEVLKDSRLGAFGTIGVCLYIIGQTILLGYAFAFSLYGLLFCAPIAARLLLIPFTALTPVHPQSFLGALTTAGPAPANKVPTLLCLFILGTFALDSITTALTCITLYGLLIYALRSLAIKVGGYNGDFLGCLILGSETLTLLCGVLFLAP